MLNLPEKRSKKWIFVVLGLFLIAFLAFLAHSMLLNLNIRLENAIALVLASLFIALVIGGGGFFGAKAYFYTALIFDGIGIAYMLYISISKAADGWSDLVGINSYLFTVGIGIVLGLIIQVILFAISKRKH